MVKKKTEKKKKIYIEYKVWDNENQECIGRYSGFDKKTAEETLKDIFLKI